MFRLAYKTGAIVLLTYALVYGLTATLPRVGDIGQTARNLFYHVPQWFSMYLMMAISLFYSVRYLVKNRMDDDLSAAEFARMGVFFGIMGLCTGIIWTRSTWGRLMPDSNPAAWWSWDPKQTYALATVLIYCAYLLLRNSVEEEGRRAQLSAIYNIFAAASVVPLTLIIPKVLGGLHPGSGDNGSVFTQGGTTNDFRVIFYPAIVGFMCLGLWIAELRIRYVKLKRDFETETVESIGGEELAPKITQGKLN